jgi:hypothetical protein
MPEGSTQSSRTAVTRSALAAALAVAGVLLFVVSQALAAGTNAGAATIVDDSHTAPLNAGGSQTTWSITLPKLAACSGDTANKAFHVFGYIVPVSVDPASVTFNANGPTTGFPLVDVTGSPFVSSNTAIGTGQVVTIPDFNFAFFGTADKTPPAVLAPGRYNVGIACANPDNTTDKFWNVVATFAASATDPSGETWAAANPSTTTTTTLGSGSTTTTTSTTLGSGPTTTTTSTTLGLGATTTTSTTSTTVAATTTTSSTVLPTTATASGHLAVTGGSVSRQYNWGVVLLGAGLIVVLGTRRRPDGS